MQIGEKLKNARLERKITQEGLAEKMGVSRQTISNWENNRSYPDIISLIKMSDIYSLSLDELLKEDKKMIEHLEESTNSFKSRQRLSKLILISVYLVIWAMSIIVFWLGGRFDAMGYSLAAFYLVIPVSTLVISVFIGKDSGWTDLKWLMLLFFGTMNMLAPYATFSLSNTISSGKFHIPDFGCMLPGILCAAAGMAIGTVIKRIGSKRPDRA